MGEINPKVNKGNPRKPPRLSFAGYRLPHAAHPGSHIQHHRLLAQPCMGARQEICDARIQPCELGHRHQLRASERKHTREQRSAHHFAQHRQD